MCESWIHYLTEVWILLESMELTVVLKSHTPLFSVYENSCGSVHGAEEVDRFVIMPFFLSPHCQLGKIMIIKMHDPCIR